MLYYEYLSEEHRDDIMSFDCSDEISVELFLKEYALQLHNVNSAITRLAYDHDRNLVGYFTLYNDMMQIGKRKRVKHGLDHLPRVSYLPAIKLHYLGVDKRFRKKQYGKLILFEALYQAKKISQNTGCNFVTVESLNKAYSFYEYHEFQYLSKSNENMINMFYCLDDFDIPE